ncbi:hypothetical protein SAMN05421796_1022 [Chryseobacterium piscicola]|uniref:VIT family protein n=1 Tax=Chryseobacterium piscicola TaxID=551459 RepID=A0A1N7L3Q0_9FLAO|nr:hypothetical protein SAMN05421796_1022 [Chryseobacterium piscicola]
MHLIEKQNVNRVGWLRASVLGANDGLLSTTSIVIGVAAAQPEFIFLSNTNYPIF